MQRYRFNLWWLFGVVGGSLFVAAIAFFFVQPWQVDRKANWFLERANQAISEDNLREAFDYQYKYVRYRSDEDDARIKLANMAVDISQLEDATQKEHETAYFTLEDTVRRTDDAELRRRFADMLMDIGRPQDAIVHLKVLLEDDPNNTELQALRVRALFLTKDYLRATKLALGLIGYDKQTKKFDAEKATAADQPEIYASLAKVLREKSNTRELARQVIDRLVEMNPDSFDAYLKRSSFLFQTNEPEAANAALEKAYELAPTDSGVLISMGRVALQAEDYETAKKYFTKALELFPDKIEIYQLLAFTETRQKHHEEAIAVLDRGIKRAEGRRSYPLLIYKINLLFETKDLPAFKKEIDKLSKVKFVRKSALQPLVDFQRARVKWIEEKWTEASKELNRVRPLLLNSPTEQTQAGYLLGFAYERLGKFDLALQSYTLALQSHPKYAVAAAGRRRMLKRIRPDEISDSSDLSLTQLVKKMLARPEDKQDWDQLDDQLAKNAKKKNFPEYRLALQRAQVFLDRGMFSEAEQLIQEQAKIEPENVDVQFAAIKLLFSTPDGGPKKAMAQLEKTVARLGPSIQSRTLRIELLIALDEDDVADKLRALTAGTEAWSTSQQVRLFSSLGTAFQRLGLTADALQYMKRAVELAPNDLPRRMRLFDFVLQQQDADAIREAQQQILDIVGDKKDASYILAEVKRRLFGFGLGKVSREEVLEARSMLDAALQQRAEWSELHVLYGQLLILLNEDMNLALQHLDEALKYGPANLKAIGLQVKLLSIRGRFEEARQVMNRLPEAVRSKVLGGTEAEVLLATGHKDEAYESAQRVAAAQPEVAKTQKWFAKLAQKTGHLDSAATAYQKAADLTPADVENWSQLLSIYAIQKKFDKLLDIFHRAQISLDAEFLPLLAAKAFEMQGHWLPAEKIYLAGFLGRYDEVAVARRLADFYLLWAPADPTYRKKSASFINRILRATYEGKIPKDHPQATWARTQAARQLAATGKYQDSLKAQQLISQGAIEGKLSVADQGLLAEILASLNNPTSQRESIRLLSELQANHQLQKKGILLLAQLLRNANQWDRCEELILDSLSRYEADVQIWSSYISMLIDRGDYSEAQNRISRLKQLDPQGASYLQLQAKLAFKEGNKGLVRKTLVALLPKKLKGTLDTKQLQTVRATAQLAIQWEDLEMAEKLYRLDIKNLPKNSFELVQFQAMYGDTEKAMAAMKKEFPNRIDQVLSLAAQMLRKRRSELGDRYDSDIDRMMASALRDDPDSTQRLLLQAEILEIEQKYQQSAEAYDKLLQRVDLPDRVRATALNNLAFLLSLMGERLEEAEQFVNQAMETLGPIDALLDTRALARIAAKKYDLAVEDMSLAVTIGRDPIKYFHLARAQLLADDKEGALESWQEARNLGIEKEKLPLLERPSYDEFESKIKQAG